ncbi:MAG: proliferating cell nuclear antigen (pcna) [Candidatus Nanoarchaeia archaeon]|nr:proliferating cell nuclear antigen (pcna) [Candidatus Nanoarchaeia archaeon]
MKLTLSETKLLTDSIAIISELVNEVVLKIDKEKIELIAMDPANVAMVFFKLLSSAFEEYSVEAEKEISVNLDAFKQVLRRAKPTDVLTLELDEEKNRLRIKLQGDSTRTFNISLLDIRENKQRVPNLEFPLTIITKTSVFDEAVGDMEIIAESVSLAANKNSFVVEAESNLHHAKVEIQNDKDTSIETTADTVKSKYSIEYLKKMIKGSKLSPNVTIQFSTNYPLKVVYEVRDKLQLGFVLAPRVSTD